MAENGDGFVRNFRSVYYEKVGFYGIEEEKVLDAIITSSPLDIEKLGDFCARFDLARRREEVWKLLLGVQCNSKNPFDSEGKVVTSIRAEHFEFLKHHVEQLLCHNLVIRKRLIQLCSSKFSHHQQQQQNKTGNDNHDDSDGDENKVPQQQNGDSNTSNKTYTTQETSTDLLTLKGCPSPHTISTWSQKNKGQHVTLMYLLESGRLQSANVNNLEATECHIMFSMASIFVNISSSLQTAFFMFKSFLKKLEQNKEFLNAQYKQSLLELARDMPELDKHIRSVSSFEDLPCWYWFRYCFIDILDEKAVLRLWDKIISGCLKCLTRVFKVIFSKLELSIMSSNSLESIRRLLTDKDKFCLREFPQNPQN